MLAPMAKRDTAQGRSLRGFCRIGRSKFEKDNNCLALELKDTLDTGDKERISEYFLKNEAALKNYQYLLLFYKLQKADGNLLYWELIDNRRIALRQSISGIFCLSGFVLNLIDSSSLLLKFQDWLGEELEGMKVLEESEKNAIREQIFIYPDVDLLLPIQDVDFIVFLGSEIKKKLGNAGPVMELDSIAQQVKRYFEVILECLENYDMDYAEKFRNFELVQRIISNDADFMILLAQSIMDHTTPENIVRKDTEWTGEEANG